MTPFFRVAKMYTTWNLCAIGLCWYVQVGQDIVRGNSLLILIVLLTVWITYDISSLYVELFDSFAPDTTISSESKQAILFVADMLLHVVPVVLIGLPHDRISLLIAYILYLVWFQLFHDKIHEIYSPRINYNVIQLVLGSFVFAFLW